MTIFQHHTARRMALMGAMGTTQFDLAKAINIVVASLVTNYCEKQGVDAAKCDTFWQKATLLETQMNEAINNDDYVGIVIVIDQLNDFKKEVQKAIDAANATPPVVIPPTPKPTGLSTGAIVGITVGVAGVLGIILYAVTR